MNPLRPAAALLVASLLLVSAGVLADVAMPGEPKYANNIMSDFVTPTVAPGETVHFGFNVSNPYDDPACDMTDVTLTVGIYQYATQEETRDVDEDFKNPPLIEGESTELDLYFEAIPLGGTERVEIDITTKEKTPHGSYFSQSTYFVRFAMVFYFPGNSTAVHLQSRGFFTDEQWDTMVSFESGDSIVNVTYMHSLGIDGLIPDSSFGIKIPIPRWPLGVLIGACCFVSFLALYYFVLDNPGSYPRLEKRFYYLRGKLRQLRGKLEHRLRK